MDKDSKILSKNSKNSEYSITFGGIAKFKPYKTDFLFMIIVITWKN